MKAGHRNRWANTPIVEVLGGCTNQVRAPSGQLAEPQKFLSQLETADIVQIENLDGSARGRSQALKICVPEREVVNPTVSTEHDSAGETGSPYHPSKGSIPLRLGPL
jgi:hypothetical protein